MIRSAGWLLALFTLWDAPHVVYSQTYPSKPIRLVVPFAPGGSLDLLARRMGQKMGEAMGQPFVIDNTPGGTGMIGTTALTRAAPDGHTIALLTVGEVIGAVYLHRNLPYDPVRDLTPLIAAVEALTLVLAHPSVPGDSLQEVLEYARRNPGKLAYASAGNGSYFHLTGELLKYEAKIDMLHVPYKSVPPALTGLAGGQVQFAFAAVASARPFLNRVKLLAVLEPNRNPAFPNVPSVTEVVPSFHKLATWFAYFAPAGLPRSVQQRLNAEMNKALGAADMREWVQANGFVAIGGSPEQLAALHKKGLETYAHVVKLAGIKPE